MFTIKLCPQVPHPHLQKYLSENGRFNIYGIVSVLRLQFVFLLIKGKKGHTEVDLALVTSLSFTSAPNKVIFPFKRRAV